MKPRGGLDPSWVYAMAHVFENSVLAGVDYVFTHGPLSFLAKARGRYYPELFSAQMIYKIVWTSLVSVVFLLRARALEGLAIRAVYLTLLMMMVSKFPNDPIHLFAITNCALLVILPTRHESATRYRLVLALVAITLALMSLGKFSNMLAALAVLPPMLIAIGLRRSGRESLQFLGFFGAVFLALWIGVAGQTLGNLLPFLRNALELTSGYSAAMGSGARSHEVRLALAGLASALAMLALSCPRFRWKAAPLYLGALVVCAALFLSWKSGFVRQAFHTSRFFVFLTLAPFLVAAPPSVGQW